MRALALTALLSLGAAPATAAIASLAECEAAVKADPALAREEAAGWAVLGGGALAKACEAMALEALGATKTAAAILTDVAVDRSNGLSAEARVDFLADAARLWLAAREPKLAEEAAGRILSLTGETAETLALRAEARGRQDRWAEARADLDRALDLEPARPDILALRAAANRKEGRPDAALKDADAALAGLPALPEALFERGAALIILKRVPEALDTWFRLIELHPDSELAALARRNIQAIGGN
jgi:tetratricopeptide (TPR) repeat protein